MAYVSETGTTGMYKYDEPWSYRVSWGGIFAGTLVALGVQLLLMLLGMGIGFGIINPVTTENMGAVGIGSGIWILACTLISLFVGGWVTARISGMTSGTKCALHGFVVWALFTFTAFYLMTTAAGGLISSFAGTIGRSASVIGGEISGVTPQMAENAMNAASRASIWGFVALLLSAGAAILGARAGRSKLESARVSATTTEERGRRAA